MLTQNCHMTLLKLIKSGGIVMTLIINVITAWISVILASLLTIIYLLRVLNKGKKKNKLIGKINKKLRKTHKPMGIAFVIIACIHGFFSSGAIFTFNFGTFCMTIGIILGLTYYLRKLFPKKLKWIKPHRGLTIMLILFLGLHLWEIGGIMGPESFSIGAERELETSVKNLYGSSTVVASKLDKVLNTPTVGDDNIPEILNGSDQKDEDVEKKNLFLGNVDLKDGTYTGVAEGYGPDLTVSVTVVGNVLTDVQIVSHNEKNEKYYGKAIDAIPAEILVAQTPMVDAISGATFTSNGIIKAVINALQTAIISGTLPNF